MRRKVSDFSNGVSVATGSSVSSGFPSISIAGLPVQLRSMKG